MKYTLPYDLCSKDTLKKNKKQQPGFFYVKIEMNMINTKEFNFYVVAKRVNNPFKKETTSFPPNLDSP